MAEEGTRRGGACPGSRVERGKVLDRDEVLGRPVAEEKGESRAQLGIRATAVMELPGLKVLFLKRQPSVTTRQILDKLVTNWPP